jgi:hypothetical protein
MSKINTTVMTVTPEMARTWLSNQAPNRRLRPRIVETLVREIRSGNWRVTHQGIAFDEDGKLVDGQHRLAAVAEASLPVQIMVTTGMEREAALRAVDQGAIRTRGDLFGMRGVANSSKTAAVCRTIGILTTPELQYSGSLGPSEDLAILAMYQDAIERTITLGDRLSARFLGTAAVLVHRDPERGGEFVTGVATGVSLQETDARLMLREGLLGRGERRSLRATGSVQGAEIMVKTACAAHAFMTGESMRQLKMGAHRFRAFCDLVGIPMNRSLFGYAGGKQERRRNLGS